MTPPRENPTAAVPDGQPKQQPPIQSISRQSSQVLEVSDPQLSLDQVFSQLTIKAVEDGSPRTKLPMAERMFSSLGVVFQHAIEQGVNLGIRDWNSVLLRADESSRTGFRDVEVLRWIRSVLDQFLAADLDDLSGAAEVLANGSRDASWRVPFGQSGILDFFLQVLTNDEVEDDVISHALRFVGNACADTDANRDQAISPTYFPSLLRHLQNDEVSEVCVSVVYNICNDYEAAQHAARANSLCLALVGFLENASFSVDSPLHQVCALLAISVEQYDLGSCPDQSIEAVVQLMKSSKVEVDDFLTLCNITKTFLQHERFQKYLVAHGSTATLLACLLKSYSPDLLADSSLSIENLQPQSLDPDEEEQISSIRSTLIQMLSDLSAAPGFSDTYPVSSPLIGSLVRWLSSPEDEIQHCSCLMLGNVARSDDTCRAMVTRYRVQERLVGILQGSTRVQVIYAALGFLKNLALPPENKPLIGTSESIEVISRFWSMETSPQIQYGAISLLRQLLNGCLLNVRRLLASLSPDQDSPAFEKTYLSLVLLLFGRTDDISAKVEIGRTIATICRCVNSPYQNVPQNTVAAILHRLYSVHGDIARPLAMMVSQSRFPIIRSEGWFALALMTRSREGSQAVGEVLQQVEVFGALVSTITGQHINGGDARAPQPGEADSHRPDSGSSGSETRSEQAQEMQLKDRENALVLVNELLKNRGDDMSVIRRSVLEDLLRRPQSQSGAQDLIARAQSEE